MKILTRSAFLRAKTYIQTYGREIDQSLFSFHFEDRDKAGVIGALKSYQNPDGGFGNALEPDLRTPASSAIATQRAFDILRVVNAGYQDETIQNAVDYLLETFDLDNGVWPIIPPEVEDAPHAPWWSYENSAETFDGFRINPTAALAGHLHHYKAIVPSDFLAQVTTQVLDILSSEPDAGMNMHDLYCYLTLAEGVEGTEKRTVLDKLSIVAPLSVQNDPSKWVEYALRPLAIAPAPDSLLAYVMDRAAIEANLDYEIDEQLEDGSWPITWSWDFVDEAAWADAEKDWKGYLTLHKLIIMKDYDRLELQ
ncbi:MAG TPA: hypothetical protein VFI27_06200 [candidate division Zixibacteria bacterium]|nr:hypothetical protein [candidate division Zixibacteria bacterium]